jgi:uncharacterized protein (DUF849 family)
MSHANPVILTCAISGVVANREQCPAIPYTPEEYLPNGEMARSNGDLVAKARAMAEDAGRRVATVAEARELLGTPKRAAA